MSSTVHSSVARPRTASRPAPPRRRVRHGVRDGAAVMMFSAAASTAFALVMLLVAHVLGSALGGGK